MIPIQYYTVLHSIIYIYIYIIYYIHIYIYIIYFTVTPRLSRTSCVKRSLLGSSQAISLPKVGWGGRHPRAVSRHFRLVNYEVFIWYFPCNMRYLYGISHHNSLMRYMHRHASLVYEWLWIYYLLYAYDSCTTAVDVKHMELGLFIC